MGYSNIFCCYNYYYYYYCYCCYYYYYYYYLLWYNAHSSANIRSGRNTSHVIRSTFLIQSSK